MAPRKPAATAKLPKKHKASESNKVTKRPARGYHKYKNGLLNVTPKGGERELVESNSKSPLLSLPAEIRNRIWEYTLGYTNYEAPVWHFFEPVVKCTRKPP
ncbi:hypothetical protein N0V87_000529 [Didymella glomerata]|uniref:Uncharacterized protein n=1 Tax=Didymella glomerata TaxID=749621 RepID=A0A9W9C493_9PLEO|nr:hypothetical protein N0V87_000529 [Didymella glomerata]